MINVDFASPSLVLGAALIGCGVALLQVRLRTCCCCPLCNDRRAAVGARSAPR
jgi:hypothetical protein